MRAPRFSIREHWRAYAVAGGLVIAAVAGVAAYNVVSSPAPEFTFKDNVVEAAGPWRLRILDSGDATGDPGCSVTLTDLDHGTKSTVPTYPAYGESMWQMQAMGSFRLKPSYGGCEINAEDGAGDASIPLTVIRGDSESFNPSGTFTVHVDNSDFGGTCQIVLRDGETGTIVDQVAVTRQSPTQEMEPGPRSSVYLSNVTCGPVKVSDN